VSLSHSCLAAHRCRHRFWVLGGLLLLWHSAGAGARDFASWVCGHVAFVFFFRVAVLSRAPLCSVLCFVLL
jgi:hypothetical protein